MSACTSMWCNINKNCLHHKREQHKPLKEWDGKSTCVIQQLHLPPHVDIRSSGRAQSQLRAQNKPIITNIVCSPLEFNIKNTDFLLKIEGSLRLNHPIAQPSALKAHPIPVKYLTMTSSPSVWLCGWPKPLIRISMLKTKTKILRQCSLIRTTRSSQNRDRLCVMFDGIFPWTET